MASIRIGFSSDFVLKNGVVGLGTTVGSTTDGKLELDNGALRANLSVSGVATLTAYGGFVAQKQHVNKPATIGFGTVGLQTAGVGTAYQYYETTTEFTDLGGVHHGDDQYFNTLSEDLIIDDGQILNITNTAMSGDTTIGQHDAHTHQSYVCAGSLEQVSVTEHFSVPCGGTNERKVAIEGTVRFNDDLNTLEFFNGNEWRQFTYNQGQSGRGILAGGYNPAADANTESNIGFINIASAGNAQNFGDLITGRSVRASSSETRALLACGIVSPTGSNIIEYITMSSSGNGIDFGDSTDQRRNHAILSSSTRAVLAGGESPANLNVMDYVQIGTLGDALDFGDLTAVRRGNTGMSSPVRGIYAGDQSDYNTSSAEFITIASKGNSLDFGELDDTRANAGSASNGVRGIVAGGYNGGSRISLVSSCIMASTGNFTSFGNLTNASDRGDGMCNSTRAIFNGGFPSNDIGMDSIEFASGGSGISFGFDNVSRGQNGGFCSDSHGGLGGF